jgi:hypothetical protein
VLKRKHLHRQCRCLAVCGIHPNGR